MFVEHLFFCIIARVCVCVCVCVCVHLYCLCVLEFICHDPAVYSCMYTFVLCSPYVVDFVCVCVCVCVCVHANVISLCTNCVGVDV